MEYWKKRKWLNCVGLGRKKGRVILVIVELFCNGPNFLSIPLLFNLLLLEMPEQKATARTAIMNNTRSVDSNTLARSGQVHLPSSAIVPPTNWRTLLITPVFINPVIQFRRIAPVVKQKKWQERRGSNSRPAVLETAALPTELHSCTKKSLTSFRDEVCVCDQICKTSSFPNEPECYAFLWS